MKKYFGILVFLITILVASRVLSCSCCGGNPVAQAHEGYQHQKMEKKETAKVEEKIENKKLYFEETKYTCPMHPDVVSDKPGKCPKCGMRLEKKESKIFSYFCPQKRCKYKSSETGKCPKHKKKLIKTEVKLYCPMDDTELQTKDGKLYCPKCKMEIKPEDVKIKKIEKKK